MVNYHRDNDYLKNESLFRNIFTKKYNLISKFIKKGKVLEIGCSTGEMLSLFKKHGWITLGVEPSGTANYARSKGLKILKTTFEEASLPENSFDLIIMNHVLEHLNFPEDVLRKAKNLLKTGGYIFIDVPNYGSLLSKILKKKWPYLLPDEHKSQFTKKSLSLLLSKVNLKVIYWSSRSGIFEYANPLLELKRKRFLVDILLSPLAFIATVFKMGDSMTFIVRKI